MANKATERQARYDATHTRQTKMKLNTETDADVLAWLSAQDNMQGAIKALIREAIARDGHERGHDRVRMTVLGHS